MELANQPSLAIFLPKVRTLLPGKDIWLYSGYTFEELTGSIRSRCRGPYTNDILGAIDVLVDGKFLMSEKDVSLSFRGSRNQRILDMPASLREDAPVWHKDFQ